MSHIAPSSVNTRGHALALLLALEVGNDQTTPRLEHARDFHEPLTLETIR